MIFYFFGAIALALGIFLRIWVSRRRFYRRGPGGLQHFNSYSGAVFTTVGERLLRLIGLILIILGIGGLLYVHKLQTDPHYGNYHTVRHNR